MKRPLIILAGPTAIGKTALSIRLAKSLGGEIISADSMQVYRHMDIGSAKATKEEMDGIPHHLIDILDPKDDFNVVRFQAMAKEAMEGIYNRGHIPVVVGGTGFYIQALLYDVDFTMKSQEAKPFSDAGRLPSYLCRLRGNGGQLRGELERLGEEHGNGFLHEILAGIDPESAAAIHENNRRRVIRAIEYYCMTGCRISEHNRRERERESPYAFYYYVLTCGRELLYARIEQRVDKMMEAGLLDEVRQLRERGVQRGMASMQGLGYKEMLDCLEGLCTEEEAARVLKRDTRHFAKRQLTWFKRERGVRWLYLEDFGMDQEAVLRHILEETADALTIKQGY